MQKGQILGEGREAVSATNRPITPHYTDKFSANKELTGENEERRKSIYVVVRNQPNQPVNQGFDSYYKANHRLPNRMHFKEKVDRLDSNHFGNITNI